LTTSSGITRTYLDIFARNQVMVAVEDQLRSKEIQKIDE